jgi:hypothetical protein
MVAGLLELFYHTDVAGILSFLQDQAGGADNAAPGGGLTDRQSQAVSLIMEGATHAERGRHHQRLIVI